MGLCSSCLKGSTASISSPSLEVRRKQQQEAAERRRVENETRGIKNVDKFKMNQQRAAELERREEESRKQGGAPNLRWQTN